MTDPIRRPRVSFVYCHYNAGILIEQALDSVLKSTPSGIPYEIIVVDDVSTDDSVSVIRKKFPSVNLIVNSETLWSEACLDKAVRIAQGEFIYFLGTDTLVHEGTVELFLDFMDREHQAHAATCKVFYPDGRFQQNASRYQNFEMALLNFTFLGHLFPSWKQNLHNDLIYEGWSWEKNHEIEASGYTNLFVRRSAIEAAGFLDTKFRQYFAEIDLCRRIRKNGGKIYYLAGGRVIHHMRGTVSKSNIQKIAENYEHDCFHYYKKYYGFSQAILLKILIVLSNILLSIKNRKRERVFSKFLVEPKKSA